VAAKTQIRLPEALHEQLVAKAAEQGVSLNALMVALLAGGIGFTLTP
jgi:predicted HicB family RNase H-like nuclease